MLVMVGSTRSHKLVSRLRELGWGRVFVGRPSPYPGELWALDNGAFAAWKSGKSFDPESFAARAWRWADLSPRFGVLPDVVGGGRASLALSLAWLPQLPPSVPWYLAVQDGVEPADVEPHAPRLAGIFLGGSDAYKARAFEWSRFAHGRGLRFHYARASSPMLLRRAFDCGADSCDSTQPLWSRDGWLKFERAIRDVKAQGSLFARTDSPSAVWPLSYPLPSHAREVP